MSRTHHHGIKNKRKIFRNRVNEWKWYRNDPKKWRKYYKHKPQRQQTRQCARKILRGYRGVLWPLDRKPRYFYQ